jgi:predicted MPP superfamily phosphohydrolase
MHSHHITSILFRHTFTLVAILLFVPSQLFWFREIRDLGRKFIKRAGLRARLGVAGLSFYALLLILNLWPNRTPDSSHLNLRAVLVQAPFRWWTLASLLAFAAVVAFYLIGKLIRGIQFVYHKAFAAESSEGRTPFSPNRRHFLARTAVVMSATPFAACAYGMLVERTDVETTNQRIHLTRLPKAFDGFRIAQLSDIHIGPFMPVEDIRRYVAMVNALKPDLIALTGDFVTWEGSPEGAVVEALSKLRAPYGIYGCLGNHERWAQVEDSITELFARTGTKILRQQNASVAVSGESLNLIGVDYQTKIPFSPARDGIVSQYLEGVEKLMAPDTANILMSHNPNTFDRAAELGIDLSLAGHTHGGQVSLEYISPNISPARLITPYVRGWFQKDGAQLYVNRGIGTIFSPVRFDCPPEITVYELKKA